MLPVWAAAHHLMLTWLQLLLLVGSASARHTQAVNADQLGSASQSESRPDTEGQSW